MTRRRFYAPPEAFTARDAGATVRLTQEESRHLRDVLRLKAGDEAFVFDGAGNEYLCAVAGHEGGRHTAATLKVRERVRPPHAESPLRLSLGVALLKGEKFDLVVQKATELGASRIMPVVTKRADVRLRDEGDAAKRTTRWQRLAVEAAKQSGRARVPEVAVPAPFASVISAAPSTDSAERFSLRLLFAERGGRTLAEIVEGARGEAHTNVAALVGPEG
ncbi:MAG: RsmE family RNA methyltransferase, partial [Pyrinomonadaceae bacterium]